MSLETTVPILVLSCSADDYYGYLMPALKDRGAPPEEWMLWDLRKRLPKDPAISIGQGEDCDSPKTMQMVVGQPGFVTTTGQLLEACQKGTQNHIIICNRCIHRAPVVARTTVELLNTLAIYENDTDERPSRVFNAIWMTFHKCRSGKNWWQQYNQAMSWLDSPWGPMRAPSAEHLIKGYDDIEGWVDSLNNFQAIRQGMGGAQGSQAPQGMG